jgi:hypothetical protein
MTVLFVLTDWKLGGNLDMHYDAVGKYLIILLLAQLLVSVTTADRKAQQVLQSSSLNIA